MGPHNILLVQIAVAEGREDDYRSWHDAHMGRIVEHVPGCVSAQRYEIVIPEGDALPAPTSRFIAVYTLTADRETFFDGLRRARTADDVDAPPDGLVVDSVMTFYESAGDAVGSP